MILNYDEVELAMGARGFTQASLAKEMRLTQGRIGQILSCARNGDEVIPRTAGNLAKALGVPVEQIQKRLEPRLDGPHRRRSARRKEKDSRSG